MNSPITGKPMKLAYEWRKIPFRKEQFDVPYRIYKCEDTGEQFTTTELDEWNMRELHNQYRAQYQIPQPEEIRSIRDQYDLSAARMGEILGFGPNTYGNYEKGEVPGLPNANLLKIARDPEKFILLVKDWEMDASSAKQTLLRRIENLIERKEQRFFNLEEYVMGSKVKDKYTGFISPGLTKLTEMVVFFAHKCASYKTKMNKLLFYADFKSFQTTGYPISGARYKAIPYGPVPNNFETLYEKLAADDVIDSFYEKLENGSQKDFLKGRDDRPFDPSLFSEIELNILTTVAETFKDTSPTKIVEISHEEIGWIANKEAKGLISYHYALDLKAL